MLAPMPIASQSRPDAARRRRRSRRWRSGSAATPSPCRTRCGRAWRSTALLPDFDPAARGARLESGRGRSRVARSEPALRFAVVHPYSGHNYELRYWLAACGIDPDRDVEIVILPPPADGGCACRRRHRRLLRRRAVEHGGGAAGARPYRHRQGGDLAVEPGKGAGRRERSGRREPGRARGAAARALPRGAMVRRLAANREELARILPASRYIARPAEWMLHGSPARSTRAAATSRGCEDFFVPFAKAATFPWKSHALWFYSQMVRWGQVAHTAENAKIARETYRPDLYRAALKPLGVALPGANAKVEGALQTPRRSARPAQASRSARTDFSMAVSSIPTSSTPTSPRQKR